MAGLKDILKRMPNQSKVFFYLLLTGVLVLTWVIVHDLLLDILAGIFIGVLARPLDKMWERLVPNRVAAALTMTTLIIVVTASVWLLAVAMYSDVRDVADRAGGMEMHELLDEQEDAPFLNRILSYVYPDQMGEQRLKSAHEDLRSAQDMFKHEVNEYGRQLPTFALHFAFSLMIISFMVYYILVDGERLYNFMRETLPLPGFQFDHLAAESERSLQAVMSGQLLVALLQGLLMGIGWVIVDLPNPVLWGLVTGIIGLLPVIGTFVVWAPAGGYLILMGHPLAGVFIILWGALVVMGLMDVWVKPKLMGRHSDIHPMLIIVSVFGGGVVFGFMGLFLGPLIAAVFVSFLRVYKTDYRDPAIQAMEAENRQLEGMQELPGDSDVGGTV